MAQHTHELWILLHHHLQGIAAYPVEIEAGVPLPDPAQVTEDFDSCLEPELGEFTEWHGPYSHTASDSPGIWRRDPPRCMQCNESCTLLFPSHHLTAEGDNLDDDHQALPDRGDGYASDTR